MTPIDQTSTSLSYGCCASTSGAAQTHTHNTHETINKCALKFKKTSGV